MSAATYSVLYEDEHVLAVDKAPGVLTVGHAGSKQRCLLDDLRRDGHRVAPVHRLDRDTSGVLLLSLDPDTRGALQAAFRERTVDKRYLALVHGRPRPARATIDVPILDQGATARADRRGKRAVSHYEVLETFSGPWGAAALVGVRMETGRHNQVRVHLAHVGHPLLGDAKFGRRRRGPQSTRATGGSPAIPARRAMLHAERLALPHPAHGQRLEVCAAPPPDFEACLRALGGNAH